MSGCIFYSSLSTETNSFSNIPTTLESFEESGILRGKDVTHSRDGELRPAFDELYRFAQEYELQVVAGLSANAAPGAPVQHGDYLTLRDEIMHRLEQAVDVKAVFLNLHGAMVSTECDDCEGDLLACLREQVGKDVPIGAVLDPHAHLTDKMVENASIMAFMKEYPHIDGLERGVEVLGIMGDIIKGQLKPIAAVHDCRLMGFFPTQDQPMRGFVDSLMEREQQEDVLSISFVHGFPWGDTPATGAKVLVYSDGNAERAREIAAQVSQDVWTIKDQTGLHTLSVDQALEKVEGLLNKGASAKPIVLADVADNPGGGAPSDSTFILRAALERGIQNIAVGLIFDPESVKACHQVGVGGTLRLRIGGKVSEYSGMPLDLDIKVEAIAKQAQMNVLDLVEMPMGDTAWVSVNGIDIVLSNLRQQMYAPAGFSHLGLDPATKSVLVVKSTNHFYATFKDIASEIIYVNSPGVIDYDLSRITYQKVKHPYYPKDIL